MDVNDIPQEWIESPPNAETFPSQFNASQKALWIKVLELSSFDNVDSKEAWNSAIQTFIETCYFRGIDPFAISANIANDTLIDDLKSQYREWIGLSNKWKRDTVEPCLKVNFFAESPTIDCTIDDLTYVKITYKGNILTQNIKNYLLSIGATEVSGILNFAGSKGETITVMDNSVLVTLKSSQQPVITDNYQCSKSELETFIKKVILPSILLTSNPV